MSEIRFKFAPAKAYAALHWMIGEAQPVDLHTVLKACYFADKAHLNKYGRPVFGATYRAMRFGPVPLEIYEMAKQEPLWMADLGLSTLPWKLEGFQLRLVGNDPPDLSVLSETDIEEITSGFEASRAMTFTERTAVTHGPDWQAARLGIMRYEDMIDDTADKPRLVEYLRENAGLLRL
jgi:hypothetical protein